MRDSGIVANGRRRLAAGEAAEATGQQPPKSWLMRLLSALTSWRNGPDQRLWFRR